MTDNPERDLPNFNGSRGLSPDEVVERSRARDPEGMAKAEARWARQSPQRELGAQLRVVRKARGLTQQQLADLVSERMSGKAMTQAYVAGIELGTVNATIETLGRVCLALGLDEIPSIPLSAA